MHFPTEETMHETVTGQPVANPRRTRLGPDWTARSTGVTARPQPMPGPATNAGAGNTPSVEPLRVTAGGPRR